MNNKIKQSSNAVEQLLAEVRKLIDEPALLYPRESDVIARLARIVEVQQRALQENLNTETAKISSVDSANGLITLTVGETLICSITSTALEKVNAIAAGDDL